MSITEDFATQWDYPIATKVVIPSQDRDFSRPKQSFFHSTMPLEDVNMNLDTTDITISSIKDVQEYLSTEPLEVVYQGPIDNQINLELLESVQSLQDELKSQLNKNFKLLSDDDVILPNFQKAVNLIEAFYAFQEDELPEQKDRILLYQENLNKPTPKPTPKPQIKTSFPESEIKKLEKLFQLPETGKITPELITALQAKEKHVASILKDKNIIGMIWNSKTNSPATTADEILKTDKALQKFQQLTKK